MDIKIDKSFEKDVKKIRDKKLLNAIADRIEEVQKSETLSDIGNCKKLKGAKNAFRIRIGDYRVGFEFENQEVVFIRFLHRDEIYKYFPD